MNSKKDSYSYFIKVGLFLFIFKLYKKFYKDSF